MVYDNFFSEVTLAGYASKSVCNIYFGWRKLWYKHFISKYDLTLNKVNHLFHFQVHLFYPTFSYAFHLQNELTTTHQQSA